MSFKPSWRFLSALLVGAVLSGCALTPPATQEAAPAVAPCPAGVPAGARCLRGQDSVGAHYLIVMPQKWSGVLVVHAHGGPSLGPPQITRADEDIKRWAITVAEGHAWAGSVFRQGGFGVTTAAEDTERVRRIFVSHVAQPRRTLLHGQSWGAMVATRAAELWGRLGGTARHPAAGPTGLDGPRARAAWNVALVLEDPAAAIHNAPYARALLDQADLALRGP